MITSSYYCTTLLRFGLAGGAHLKTDSIFCLLSPAPDPAPGPAPGPGFGPLLPSTFKSSFLPLSLGPCSYPCLSSFGPPPSFLLSSGPLLVLGPTKSASAGSPRSGLNSMPPAYETC